MDTYEYVAWWVVVLALTSWFVFRQLMHKSRRFEFTSPLIELMDRKARIRQRRYAKCAAISVYIAILAAGLSLVWYLEVDLPYLMVVVGFVAYLLAQSTYRRRAGFLKMHDAFDGGICSGTALGSAVGLFYANQGTGKIVVSMEHGGKGGLVLTYGKKSFVLRTTPGANPMVMALALTTIATPVNVYGLLIEFIGGRPTTEVLTNPIHPELP